MPTDSVDVFQSTQILSTLSHLSVCSAELHPKFILSDLNLPCHHKENGCSQVCQSSPGGLSTRGCRNGTRRDILSMQGGSDCLPALNTELPVSMEGKQVVDKLIFDSTPVGVVNELNCQNIQHFYLSYAVRNQYIYILSIKRKLYRQTVSLQHQFSGI